MENVTPAVPPRSPEERGLLERLLDEAETAQASRPAPPFGQGDTPPSESPPTAGNPSGGTPASGGLAGGDPPSGNPAGGNSSHGSPTDGNPSHGSPAGGNLLGALLSDPAILSALPVLMENLSPLLGGLGRGGGAAQSPPRAHTADRHTALLCALKPYLSPRRRDVAETVLRLCRVWDALERSGISVTGLLSAMGGTSPSREEGRDDRVQ